VPSFGFSCFTTTSIFSTTSAAIFSENVKGFGMLPNKKIADFARVGTAVHCLPSMKYDDINGIFRMKQVSERNYEK
jgi:hypothetical protein